jgi:NAD(P)-dependent dehydrogenase (short-subunit alcohol dehydrogenase family)
MRVQVLDRDGAAEHIVADDIDGLAAAADVTSAAEVEKAVAAALAHFGRIDLRVNNAGICWTGPALENAPRRAAGDAQGQCRGGVHNEPRGVAADDRAAGGCDRQPRLVGGQDR